MAATVRIRFGGAVMGRDEVFMAQISSLRERGQAKGAMGRWAWIEIAWRWGIWRGVVQEGAWRLAV